MSSPCPLAFRPAIATMSVPIFTDRRERFWMANFHSAMLDRGLGSAGDDARILDYFENSVTACKDGRRWWAGLEPSQKATYKQLRVAWEAAFRDIVDADLGTTGPGAELEWADDGSVRSARNNAVPTRRSQVPQEASKP